MDYSLTDPQLFTAFLAGLFGGVHCLGMCGGIVASLSFGLPKSVSINNSAINQSLIGYLFAYNLGRILSYVIAGMLVGGFSMLAANLLNINYLQMVLQLLAGLLMLFLGLYLAGWWSGLTKIEQLGLPVWKKVEPVTRQFIPVKSIKNAFFLGMLWGWLPCGLVYTILFLAIASASLIQGGLIMLSFALGTLPMLILMGVFASSLREFIHHQGVRQLAGISIMAFSCYNFFLVYQALYQ